MTRPASGSGAPRDPFQVLGVEPTAGEDELRAARRRLAKELHPDRAGGDANRMRELNLAFDAAMAAVHAAPIAPGTHRETAHPTSRAPAGRRSGHRPQQGGRAEGARRSGTHHAHDVASFTIEALPAEAYEALLVASSWIGEVLEDEPPYRLTLDLGEPFDCWCRLDLIPDAGSSTVGVTLASRDGRPVPDLDAVRDTFVATLNTLGRPEPA